MSLPSNSAILETSYNVMISKMATICDVSHVISYARPSFFSGGIERKAWE